ncbi:peptidoglycan-binding domain-containing protein [Streptomyces sp. NPDC052109]|uniref:peptidoglycan-binding domain-containing protein n=1 Tax=Streptomyces sp. NPDC052109 TaxID=3155527 RepID=UPI0034190983
MTESEGQACPECGAPRGADRSPSCDCAERTAEALRETRAAEAAAAEDFDPLRIRPYVDVTAPHPLSGTERHTPLPPTPGPPPETETRPVPAVPGPSARQEHTWAGTGGGGSMGDGNEGLGAVAVEGGEPGRRRPPRTVLLSVAGAGVAVVAVAGFAGGLFSYHTPSRDRAAQEVRESVPDVNTPDPTSPTAAAAPTAPRSSVPSPSASATRPSPSATPSTSPPPTPAPSAETSRPASPTPSAAPRTTPAAAPVLRRGDQGPEVTELQERLRQLNLYGDRISGIFTRTVEDAVSTYQLARGIRGDALGVYGPATRERLEAETREP